jgi:Cft2 family RNA processing exonuclease
MMGNKKDDYHGADVSNRVLRLLVCGDELRMQVCIVEVLAMVHKMSQRVYSSHVQGHQEIDVRCTGNRVRQVASSPSFSRQLTDRVLQV